jgi:hypothetical protein
MLYSNTFFTDNNHKSISTVYNRTVDFQFQCSNRALLFNQKYKWHTFAVLFLIFVASVDPLSKNKSRIIIHKCWNFCRNRRLNIDGWYVFARRKGLKIYFLVTNSLYYVKYFLTIWWNRHRRFQCKENMTVNAPIFFTTGAFNIVLRCTSLYA